MILVEVRCKAPGCGRLLASIPDPLPPEILVLPRDAVSYRVPPCPRHGGTVDGFRRLAAEGKTVSLGFGPLRVTSAVLWPAVDEAWRTSRTQVVTV